VLHAIKDGLATKVNELPGGEPAQGLVFTHPIPECGDIVFSA